MASAVPQPKHTVVPYLRVKGAAQAIDFYVEAFGATEVMRMPSPDGRLMHAEISIDGSPVYVSDEFPEFGNAVGAPNGAVSVHLNIPDVDARFEKAGKAGATAIMPPADMFWGDRFAKLRDPFGHEWSLSTTVEQLSPDEMRRRGDEAMKQMRKG
jgi:PhnB protein